MDTDGGDARDRSLMWPVRDPSGTVRAAAIAAFDSSEQHWARQRLAMLNEAGVSSGTTLDVVQTAAELAQLLVPRLADFTTVDLLESVLRGEEPAAGPARRPRAGRRRLASGDPSTDGLGAGGGGLRHRTDRQRAGHQRHPLRPPADQAAADPGPRPDLRGLRRRQHRPAPAPVPDLRGGRPRTAAGRPAHPALGHPAGRGRQDHPGRAGAAAG